MRFDYFAIKRYNFLLIFYKYAFAKQDKNRVFDGDEFMTKHKDKAHEDTHKNHASEHNEKDDSKNVKPEATEDAATSPENPDVCDDTVVVEDEKEVQPSEEEKLRDRLLRLQADFDNYRKRVARDHRDMVKAANNDLVESLLPVLDHVGHALDAMQKAAGDDEDNPYVAGFMLVRAELLKALAKYGLEPVDSFGKPFDINVHEALSTAPSADVAPDTVIFEVRKGYLINGKVLRAAQVIVSTAVENGGAE